MNQLVTPSFLFRWSFPVRQISSLPHKTGELLNLLEECRIPSITELDSQRDFADLRLAWNSHGLAVSVDVRGRTKKLECSASTPEQSDGLTIWVDTRNTQGVHRATKYCHQFCLMPSGTGRKSDSPVAVQIPLARSREDSATADVSLIQMQSVIERDGYRLEAWLPAEVFVGFDPSTSPRIGFHYQVRDRELGMQTLAVGTEFPVASDPSLWQRLELVGA